MWHHLATTQAAEILFPRPECIFCNADMLSCPVDNLWDLNEDAIRKEHDLQVRQNAIYVDGSFLLHRPIMSVPEVVGTVFRCCPVCGWWCVIRELQYETPAKGYSAYQWAAGALTSVLPSPIDSPVEELRSYLCARYSDRFSIEPYQFEKIVTSILKSYRLDVQITSRSNDGGLDVIGIDGSGEAFGVQVKRYRGVIEIEQLRSFVGALVLHGLPQGMFVTTSGFTAGAKSVCQKAELQGIKLSLIDSERLLEMLKIAQIKDFDKEQLPDLADSYSKKIKALNYGYSHHLGSL
ncbi:restriction endonuclease [Achromobacter anxifer]|uniref:restriction endonuclease n=1 Tax=Achromobacter anxifer TaxID=1287737 RepID=UPI0021572CC8|nr:restriction endonuclease [Achromobacter anxifer]